METRASYFDRALDQWGRAATFACIPDSGLGNTSIEFHNRISMKPGARTRQVESEK